MTEIVRDILTVLTFVVVVALFLQSRGISIVSKAVPPPRHDEEETVKVKRTRPSLRNPMRPYDVRYDDFKTKRGLYEPVKPRGRTREQEDELEV